MSEGPPSNDLPPADEASTPPSAASDEPGASGPVDAGVRVPANESSAQLSPAGDAEAVWAWLVGLRPEGIKLGLERIEALLGRLGSPHEALAAVTIAGTNGKGSTAVFLSAMVHAAGYRVGLYTSPHLLDVSERIRVGNIPIAPADFVRLAGRVRDAMASVPGTQEPIAITYFEALTAIALLYFVEREVDLAVLEVGLGGRYDATAVVPPLVAVLTSIGYDHQEFLGSDLESICREKAGIIKAGATVVTGVKARLFRKVVGPKAFDERCPIRRAGVDFVWQWLDTGFRYRGWINRVGPVRLGLHGIHQGHNAGLACAAVESLAGMGFAFKPVHMYEGLERARHPGRLERRPRWVDRLGRSWAPMLLDGAHNPAATHLLQRHIRAFLPERPRVLLFSAKRDKDYRAMLKDLAPKCDVVVLTSPEGAPMQGLGDLATAARGYCADVLEEPDVTAALELARQMAGEDGGILVAGSLYLVGGVMAVMNAVQSTQ